MCVCAGIDVDIDVEHEGQRTKVTPPSKSGEVDGDVEMDGASEGSKVSTSSEEAAHLCDVFQVTQIQTSN